jgi:MFS family permease
MQGVGAAWLMTELVGTPDMVALVQTATLAPILLFAPFAGALADLLDRRSVLLAAQLWMCAAAVGLAALSAAGWLTPALLLLLTFALGAGAALNGPAWQVAVREIVPASDLPAAVTLNAIGFNIARAVGPALGGVLVAAAGVEATFVVNAVSSFAVIAAVLAWRRVVPRQDLPRERIGHAVVAGVRYVRETPAIRAILLRASVFGILASAAMALLPLVARDRLGGDATLYGLLLGSFGLGALIGAFVIHPLRQARGAEFVVTALTAVFGGAFLVIGLFPRLLPVTLALPLAGAAWLGSFSTFNISVQMSTAPWVQARVLAIYQTVVFGGMALGSWAGATWRACSASTSPTSWPAA